MRRKFWGMLRLFGIKRALIECAILDFMSARRYAGRPISYEQARAKVMSLLD